jgi:hypothetical protein
MLVGTNPVDAACALVAYSSVPVSASSPPCFTFLSTPTTVNHGVSGPPLGRIRRPMMLWPG